MSLGLKKILLYSIFFGILCFLLSMNTVPPVSRDALTHHLAVPKLYIENGGIREFPEILPSYYPQLIDLIYTIPLMFKNDILPKYIHFLFALLTAGLIFFYIRNRLNGMWGMIGVIFYLTLPVIIKLSTTVYVDLGLIFFSFAALLGLVKWKDSGFQFKWLLYSSVLCGLALSTKYNGLITLFILTVFVPVFFLSSQKNKQYQVKSLLYAIVFIAGAMTVFSPWMIKNYIWTGNPVYPLYNQVFNDSDVTEAKTADETLLSGNHFLIRKYVYKEAWWETALIPVRIFFQGKDDDPAYFDGKLNPLLLMLPVFAFFRVKRSDSDRNYFDEKVMLGFSLLYILFVFVQNDMRIRWMGPAIPPLVVLSIMGFHHAFMRVKQNRVIMVLFLSAIVILAGQNLVYLVQEFKNINPIPYLAGDVSRDDYIQKRRPEYATLQYANKHLDGDVKILALFLGNRRYYSDHDIAFKHDDFKQIITDSDHAQMVSDVLKEQGYTHLVVNFSAFNNWAQQQFSPAHKDHISRFFKTSCLLLFQKDGHGIYQIL